MRTKTTNLLCALAAFSIAGTAMAMGCSGTTNSTASGGSGGSGNGSAAGGNDSSSGTAAGGNGMGGEGGGFIPGTGGGDAGLDPDSACASQSAQATLAKKPVDIIIVIDNSGSMTAEIVGVEKNINQNFAQIIESSGIDYRVILVARHGSASSSQSVCIEAPLSGIAAGGCSTPPAEPVDNPPKFYHYNTEIGSLNSLCKIIDTFTTPDLNGKAPNGWKEWLRPDSFKTFIELTDDNISCTTTTTGVNFADQDTVAGGVAVADKFDTELLKLAPEHFGTKEERNYAFYSIVGMTFNDPATKPYDPADPILTATCPGGVDSGTGYQGLSVLTNALRFPLCDTTSYDVVFQAIAQGVIEGSKVACDFPLPEPPMGQSLDIDTVVVQYTPAGMGAPTNFKKVADASACAPDSFYIDPATKQVYLCPDACSVVQTDDKAKIDVLFACEVGGAN